MRVGVIRTGGRLSIRADAGTIEPWLDVAAFPDSPVGTFGVALSATLSTFRFAYSGQSSARPLRTSHSPRSVPPTEQVATVLPYGSRLRGEQLTGRRAMNASRSFAACAPQRYCKLSSPRQSWLLSGVSIPHSRIRIP